MHLSIPPLLALASLALSTSITLYLPPKPNPFALPPATHATLSSLHKHLSAPLSAANTFVFHNVTPDSYLVDVHCPTDGFHPLRIDVAADGGVAAWETYRGNEWGNKGEALVVRDASGGKGVEVRALGGKVFFLERPSFSILSILKSPMILMGLGTMGIVFGLPYLMDNMDPDMRAEFEEHQRSSPMNSIMGGGGGPQNFDMAAYLAGSNKKEGGGGGGSGNGGGNGGGAPGSKQQGVRR
ncbi:hypothetical protein PT974_00200 [Cladobotryum mycophilum]|uniref:ER membrane protein complex subunit 7 beta-sandwich domain-containing protein n=1 Tax=Cladobotryum mycophilum TaxID=491253 RepID=A0ABR0T0F6_9HYPO